MPTELIVHCILSNNVSAEGSVKNIITPRLDGTFIKSSNNKTLNNIAMAEQVIREYLSAHRALQLLRVEFLTLAERKIMLAHTMGIRRLSREETGLA